MPEFAVRLRRPHDRQEPFLNSTAKRKMIRAGRRGGKTVGLGIHASRLFLAGRRVLYAAPTEDQISTFWYEVTRSLRAPIRAGIFKKNETMHSIELPGTRQRIRAKTAYNADTLRGDYADVLILDEWQLMNEETWDRVGAPMLLDNDGDAIFIYTPPSLQSRSMTKARDPQHAAKMFKRVSQDTSGRWETFHFRSYDNPHISRAALEEIAQDMTSLAYRQEILAEDIDEAPGALWSRDILEQGRWFTKTPERTHLVVAVDPNATSTGDEAGIITAFSNGNDFFVLEDSSLQGGPLAWATEAVQAYHRHDADAIVAESNQGGDMVALTIKTIDATVPVKLVHASRGKQTRAAPISAIFEQGRGHMVGNFEQLEDELALWVPGDPSPNRLDAMVWAASYLMLKPKKQDRPPVGTHSFSTV